MLRLNTRIIQNVLLIKSSLNFGVRFAAIMPHSANELEAKLVQALQTSFIKVVDVSDGCCGAKFDCIIVSSQFEGKPLLQRHRMVNTILADELKSIHAFTQKTLTPSQWETQQNAAPSS